MARGWLAALCRAPLGIGRLTLTVLLWRHERRLARVEQMLRELEAL